MNTELHATVSLLGLELTVDLRLAWARALLANLQDAINVSASGCAPLDGSIRIECADVRSAAKNGEPLGPGLRRSGDTLLDLAYGVQVSSPVSGEIVLRTAHSCPEWFSWALQLQALRNRAVFVHAAGLERGGTALLLAARNGFGKTALVGDFVGRCEWRLLGDDLTLLTEDGVCYAYPRALVLHPEHRSFFPAVFADHQGPTAPRAISRSLERAGHFFKPLLRHVPVLLEATRRHNPQAARVLPSSALGEHKLALNAALRHVVWLERRPGLRMPVLAQADDSMAARLFDSTIAEFDVRCVRATNTALALGLPDLEGRYGEWVTVLRSGLRRAQTYMLSVPSDLPLERMPAFVHDVLAANHVLPSTEVLSCG